MAGALLVGPVVIATTAIIEAAVEAAVEEAVSASVTDAITASIKDAIDDTVINNVNGTISAATAKEIEESLNEKLNGKVKDAIGSHGVKDVARAMAAIPSDAAVDQLTKAALDEVTPEGDNDLPEDQAKWLAGEVHKIALEFSEGPIQAVMTVVSSEVMTKMGDIIKKEGDETVKWVKSEGDDIKDESWIPIFGMIQATKRQVCCIVSYLFVSKHFGLLILSDSQQNFPCSF